MTEFHRVLLTALPLLLLALLGVLVWRWMRRVRERDEASPPAPRAMALRALPFMAIVFAGGIWGLIAQDYERVAWGAVGVLGGSYGLFGYWRHQRKQ